MTSRDVRCRVAADQISGVYGKRPVPLKSLRVFLVTVYVSPKSSPSCAEREIGRYDPVSVCNEMSTLNGFP